MTGNGSVRLTALLVVLFGSSQIWAQDEVAFDAADIEGSAIKIRTNPERRTGYAERSVGGRPAVCTDLPGDGHWLVFDIPDDFAYDDPTPLTLVVTYFDQPSRLMEIQYDAQDDQPAMQKGPEARLDRFERTGAFEWRTLAYRLPAPKIANRLRRIGDIGIMGHTWTGDPRAGGVAISDLKVSRRYVTVECEPATLAQGQDDHTVTVTAMCYASPGVPAPDGSEVAFSDASGRLQATALTQDGRAEATFEGSAQPGLDWVTAEWDGIPGYTKLHTLGGQGPVRSVEFDVDSFNGEYQWPQPTMDGVGTTAAQIDHETHFAGGGALRVDYAFDPDAAATQFYTVPMEQELPGHVSRIWFQVLGGRTYHWVDLGLRDRENEYYWYEIGRITSEDWQEMSWDESYPAVDIIGPAGGNRTPDLPLTLVGFRILRTYRSEQNRTGALFIDEIKADCEVAEPEQ